MGVVDTGTYLVEGFQSFVLLVGAVLRSVSYWGVPYLVAEIELYFYPKFLIFREKVSFNFVRKYFLRAGAYYCIRGGHEILSWCAFSPVAIRALFLVLERVEPIVVAVFRI